MTENPNAVMLFAAGFGTRMGPLTRDKPKPLIQVGGRPLIDHCLTLVDELAPRCVVANLHYHAQMLADHLTPRGIKVSVEQPEILETGGGLRAALPLLGPDPVFTMNTDAIWAGPNPLLLLQEQWDPEKMDALLACIPIARTVGHSGTGDFSADQSGRINRGPDLVYGGVQILKTDGLGDIAETAFSLNLLWDKMHEKDRLFALTYPGYWCDVGRPEGIGLAESMLAAGHV